MNEGVTTVRPTSPAEVQEAVRAYPKLLPRGGGSKPALSTPRAGQAVLELRGLSGVREYDPGEYVLVAWAGTPLSEVQALLAQHGQYLPFDPPLAEAGATLGGTVAAGLSGPMRQRYGGVRDFILGVRFVDGEGRLVRGGGKVVKNAAGFDLPKLMVGSLGRLGVLVELAFKVFPFPPATATLEVAFDRLEEALEALYRLSTSPLECYALDLIPPATLALRLGGLGEALPSRLERLCRFLGDPPEARVRQLEGQAEREYWAQVNRLAAPPGGHWVKVPLRPGKIPALEARLGPAPRRYLAGGNLLYLCWSDPLAGLAALLREQGLSGLVFGGDPGPQSPLIGVDLEHRFARRVSAALDPQHRFS